MYRTRIGRRGDLTVTDRSHKGFRVVMIIVVVVVLLLGGLAAGAWYLAPPVNVLLMGLDEGKTRTDVVVLAHLDPRKGLLTLLSLPRDTLVEIDCTGLSDYCVSPDKLAHAHAYAGERGPEVTVATVERLLGVKIDHYVRVDFEGFKQVVDILGGVDLVIDQDMYYEDPYADPPLLINFTASEEPQHLDGQRALEFVRYRGATGDIGRTERTKHFLVALARKARQTQSLTKLPEVIRTGLAYVDTDIDTTTALTLALGAMRADLDNVQMETLPGYDDPHNPRGWVWIPDETAMADVVDRLIVNPQPPSAEPEEGSGEQPAE